MTPTLLQLAAVGLLLVGFAFKVSAVPFHMWTPDAYEGAPTVVTAFGPASGRGVRRLRPRFFRLRALRDEWYARLGIAAATMIMGTVVGVAQTSVKRMLAYSSIALAAICSSPSLSANDIGKTRPVLPF